MNKDKVSCDKCEHCFIVVVADGAAMVCPYQGVVGHDMKKCKDYEPKEKYTVLERVKYFSQYER